MFILLVQLIDFYSYLRDGFGQNKDIYKQFEAIILFICEYTEDKVVNLRFLAVETLYKYLGLLKQDLKLCLASIKQIRQVFKSEKDAEVQNMIKVTHKALKKYV